MKIQTVVSAVQEIERGSRARKEMACCFSMGDGGVRAGLSGKVTFKLIPKEPAV